ncbi:hypothetical protein HZS_8157 [Henneguya salminicola]|nr:hypothetical protein HZS_8157 [Henneguya salminicola]
MYIFIYCNVSYEQDYQYFVMFTHSIPEMLLSCFNSNALVMLIFHVDYSAPITTEKIKYS